MFFAEYSLKIPQKRAIVPIQLRKPNKDEDENIDEDLKSARSRRSQTTAMSLGFLPAPKNSATVKPVLGKR